MKNVSRFFDKMQIVLHFFDEMLKVFQLSYYDCKGVSIFSTKREKCLYFGQDVQNVSCFFAKMQEIIVFFTKKQNFYWFFYYRCANFGRVSQTVCKVVVLI